MGIWVYDIKKCPDAEPLMTLRSSSVAATALSLERGTPLNNGIPALLVNVNDGLHLYDLNKRQITKIYRGQIQSRFVIRACFGGGSNNAFVASGSEDSRVFIWHREKTQCLSILEG